MGARKEQWVFRLFVAGPTWLAARARKAVGDLPDAQRALFALQIKAG